MDHILNPMDPVARKGSITNTLAIDCEFVKAGDTDLLARVSIVNEKGEIVLDTLVSPTATVTDYLTDITGLKEGMLDGASSYEDVNRKVLKIIQGKTIVGHSLKCDLQKFQSLFPICVLVRDVSDHKEYQNSSGLKRKLKTLTKEWLKAEIQEGAHSSIIDARAALALYLLRKTEFDTESAVLCWLHNQRFWASK
jgi:RNA exonuclease 4